MEPEFDADGYPTAGMLSKIATWPGGKHPDWSDFFAYIKAAWAYAEAGYWKEKDGVYELSTAGWSGNESIIDAMEKNFVFWPLMWHSSTRGGHYIFRSHENWLKSKGVNI